MFSNDVVEIGFQLILNELSIK